MAEHLFLGNFALKFIAVLIVHIFLAGLKVLEKFGAIILAYPFNFSNKFANIGNIFKKYLL